MKPTICEICHKRFTPSDKAGVVYFRKSPGDIEWDKRVEEEGIIGHPPYAEWFCEIHHPQAKKMETLTRMEAMNEFRKSAN